MIYLKKLGSVGIEEESAAESVEEVFHHFDFLGGSWIVTFEGRQLTQENVNAICLTQHATVLCNSIKQKTISILSIDPRECQRHVSLIA